MPRPAKTYTNAAGDTVVIDYSRALTSSPPQYHVLVNGTTQYVNCSDVNGLITRMELVEVK